MHQAPRIRGRSYEGSCFCRVDDNSRHVGWCDRINLRHSIRRQIDVWISLRLGLRTQSGSSDRILIRTTIDTVPVSRFPEQKRHETIRLSSPTILSFFEGRKREQKKLVVQVVCYSRILGHAVLNRISHGTNFPWKLYSDSSEGCAEFEFL